MVEYGFIVQTIDIKPDMEDATADQLSQAMAMKMTNTALPIRRTSVPRSPKPVATCLIVLPIVPRAMRVSYSQ